MYIIFLIMVTASLVATAAYFSVVGVASIFAYNYVPAMIRVITTRSGKIKCCRLLYQYWRLMSDGFRASAEAASAPPVARRMLGMQEFAEMNDDKLLQVFVGMSQKNRKAHGRPAGAFVNPYKHQSLKGSDGKAYDVLFYLTRLPREGKRITESQLTPVILRDDKVLTIGRYP